MHHNITIISILQYSSLPPHHHEDPYCHDTTIINVIPIDWVIQIENQLEQLCQDLQSCFNGLLATAFS